MSSTAEKTKAFPEAATRLLENREVRFTFEDADGDGQDEGGDAKPVARRFAMEPLLSGNIIPSHWFWGNLGIELAGVQLPAKRIPALLQHDTNARAGFTTELRLDAELGIVASGQLLKKSPAADEIAELAAEGFPWQASPKLIPMEIEELEKGDTATVNGKEITGPGTIFRTSRLREASFVTLGADEDTSASTFAAKSGGEQLTTRIRERPMTTTDSSALSADALRRDHAELAAEIATEGETTERARVAAILEAADAEQHELALTLIREGVDEATALRRINKDLRERIEQGRAAGFTAGATDDALGEGSTDQTDGNDEDVDVATLAVDDAAKHLWEGDENIRREFGADRFDLYLSWYRAERKGQHGKGGRATPTK